MEGLIFFLALVIGIFCLIIQSECDDEPSKKLRYVAILLFLVSFLDILGLYTAQKVKYIERPVFEVKYPEGYKKQFVVNPSLKLEELEGYDDEIKVRKYDIYRNSIFQYSFYRLEKNDG